MKNMDIEYWVFFISALAIQIRSNVKHMVAISKFNMHGGVLAARINSDSAKISPDRPYRKPI